MYWVTHARSGTKMKLANRPKLAKDKEDPPNVTAKITAAIKEGKERFRISGEIIRNPTNVVLLESADVVEKKEE